MVMVKIDSGNSAMAIFQRHMEPKADQGMQQAESREAVSGKQAEDSVTLDNAFKMEAKAFSQSAKSANEAIGLLQVAEINLNKVQKALDSGDDEAAAEIMNSASFMGNKIFGESIDVQLSGEVVSLSMDMGELVDAEAIASKKAEISDLLSQINDDLSQSSESLSRANSSNYDFNTFDPAMLKNMGGAF